MTSENKIAKQTNYNTGKIVCLNLSNVKEKSVTVKISSLVTNICVGVGLKDVIKNNSYKWNRNYVYYLRSSIRAWNLFNCEK